MNDNKNVYRTGSTACTYRVVVVVVQNVSSLISAAWTLIPPQLFAAVLQTRPTAAACLQQPEVGQQTDAHCLVYGRRQLGVEPTPVWSLVGMLRENVNVFVMVVVVVEEQQR